MIIKINREESSLNQTFKKEKGCRLVKKIYRKLVGNPVKLTKLDTSKIVLCCPVPSGVSLNTRQYFSSIRNKERQFGLRNLDRFVCSALLEHRNILLGFCRSLPKYTRIIFADDLWREDSQRGILFTFPCIAYIDGRCYPDLYFLEDRFTLTITAMLKE